MKSMTGGSGVAVEVNVAVAVGVDVVVVVGDEVVTAGAPPPQAVTSVKKRAVR